jgi:hypothetical protein
MGRVFRGKIDRLNLHALLIISLQYLYDLLVFFQHGKEHQMFLMWIVPLLFIGLIVYAVSGNNLLNAFRLAANRVCANCGKPAQNDWKTCPHCGQTL